MSDVARRNDWRQDLAALYIDAVGSVQLPTAGLDSLKFVNFLLGLEKRFGVTIPEEVIDRDRLADLAGVERVLRDLLTAEAPR